MDSQKRLIGILAGNPGDQDWASLTQKGTEAFEYWGAHCSFPKERDRKGKRSRGDFDCLACGVSYGGGQTKPTNVSNNVGNQKAL